MDIGQLGGSRVKAGLGIEAIPIPTARRCYRGGFEGWLQRALPRTIHGPGLRGDLRSGECR